MRAEHAAVRPVYLPVLATAFAAVPLAGYALILWLGFATPSSLFESWSGWALSIFAAAWWLSALFYFRRLLTAALQASRGAQGADHAGRALARLHGHYWLWLGAYALAAAIFYAAGRAEPVAPPLYNWAQCLLLQLIAAVLAGMPFYLRLLSTLTPLIGEAGVDRIALSVEAKLLLMAVLTPLTAGAALMYFHWRHDAAWSLGDLLAWSGLGALLLAVGLLGVRHLRQALLPLQKIVDAPAPRPEDLIRLRPASADEFGLLIQSLGRLGAALGHEGIRARALIDAVSNALVLTDAAGRIVMLNSAAERLLDCLASRAKGMPIRKLLPDVPGEGGMDALVDRPHETRALRNGEPVRNSVRVSRVGREEPARYVCLITPLAAESPRPPTPLPEEPYRDLVESSRDLIWRSDRGGRLTFVNAASRYIYGLAPADIIGQDVHTFTEPGYLASEQAALRALWEGRDWLEFESVHHDHGGALHHLSIVARARKGARGEVTDVTGVTRDVTARKMYEQKLIYQASHDALTGLFNRHYLRQELDRMVARVSRGGPGGALLFLDLDQLKFINDELGHNAGDRLLSEAANLMKAHVREGDLLARYGGDEFTVLLYNTQEEGARTVAENLRACFGDYRFLEGGNGYTVTCSIGVALLDQTVKAADDCLDRAERACNAAKNLGRNRVVFHTREEPREAAPDHDWTARIKRLIEDERFQLVYQPIAALSSGSVYDYEVLLRLVEREGHVLNPGAFLPTAERLGLSRRVDRSVVTKAIRSLADLRAGGQPVRFFLNLCAQALRDDALLRDVKQTLAETGLEASVLTFEITETAAVADLAATTTFIEAVNGMGARVVLEHFGQGFSSFSYLRHLPVDALKIDGAYVQGLSKSVVNQMVVRSINQVAHALGKLTIAPQVENREALILLRDLGVDYAQGYFVGRPEESIGTERYISTELD